MLNSLAKDPPLPCGILHSPCRLDSSWKRPLRRGHCHPSLRLQSSTGCCWIVLPSVLHRAQSRRSQYNYLAWTRLSPCTQPLSRSIQWWICTHCSWPWPILYDAAWSSSNWVSIRVSSHSHMLWQSYSQTSACRLLHHSADPMDRCDWSDREMPGYRACRLARAQQNSWASGMP